MNNQKHYNFSAGPGCQPTECLEQMAKDMLNWNDTGLSIAEVSHRSPAWSAEMNDIRRRLRSVLNVPSCYEILLIAGGASLQFSALPFNLLGDYDTVDYLVTGHWSEKAYEECSRLNFPGVRVNCVVPIGDTYRTIPDESKWNISEKAAYFYICSNESANGIQFKTFPKVPSPLVVDMSSDFLSRRIEDWSNIGVIFACAQKNFGLAGVSIVVIRKDLLERRIKGFCPLTLDYRVQVKYESMYNTPPTIPIHFAKLILKWIEESGGMEMIEEHNKAKAKRLYEAIDRSPHFTNDICKEYRSDMNVTFFGVVDGSMNKDSKVDDEFLDFCKKRNIVTLKGFSAVGGFRASIYNAMSDEGVDALIAAIDDFPGFC